MSIQPILDTAQAYGAAAYNWVTTNGAIAANYIMDLAHKVWNAVQPHFETLKNYVIDNQAAVAAGTVCVAAVALLAASYQRIVDCILCRTPAAPAPAGAAPAPASPVPPVGGATGAEANPAPAPTT